MKVRKIKIATGQTTLHSFTARVRFVHSEGRRLSLRAAVRAIRLPCFQGEFFEAFAEVGDGVLPAAGVAIPAGKVMSVGPTDVASGQIIHG